MEIKIKRTIAFFAVVCFLVSLTATAVSAAPEKETAKENDGHDDNGNHFGAQKIDNGEAPGEGYGRINPNDHKVDTKVSASASSGFSVTDSYYYYAGAQGGSGFNSV